MTDRFFDWLTGLPTGLGFAIIVLGLAAYMVAGIILAAVIAS